MKKQWLQQKLLLCVNTFSGWNHSKGFFIVLRKWGSSQQWSELCFCFMAPSCWCVDAQSSLCLLGSAVASAHLTLARGGAEKLGFLFFSKLFPSYQRCLGTTKQRLMDTWNSWRRPRWRTWTRRMRMAWLPPYWLLFMDISVLFSSYAAESKLSIACPSSHILHWDKNDLNIWVLVKCFLQAV